MYLRVPQNKKLNFEYFIARKLLKNEVEGKKVSQPIVRISIISIALAMVVNIITLAVVKGFQEEVRNKVIGFGSHATITKAGENTIFESDPIPMQQSFYPNSLDKQRVPKIQPVAYKAALLQSNYTKKNPEHQQEIQGVLVKGVDSSYAWDFFEEHLISGRVPILKNKQVSDEVIISKKIASDLNFKIGDRIRSFFVKNKPVKKYFTLVGIYDTGFEELDKQIVVGDIRHIQKLNDWGIQTSLIVDDTLQNGMFLVKTETIGGNGRYRYDWGQGYERFGGFTIYPTKDTLIRVIVSDYWMFIDGKGEKTTLPDTAYLQITIEGNKENYSPIDNDKGVITKRYLDDNGFHFRVQAGEKSFQFRRIDGKGSYSNYVGAFECSISNWEDLESDINYLKSKVLVGKNIQELKVSSIIDSQSDIFIWLGFLDVNVWIILSLMIIIGIINMGSALLVMILVKTNFIGLMKGIGANDWTIRKIFLHQAGFLILRGMLWGNSIGVGICVIQKYTHWITLNPKVYYLNAVPIQLNLGLWVLLNLATLLICLLALLVPSYMITKISPSKSIKFN
jgi:lipoprotein-releasing system permease protein